MKIPIGINKNLLNAQHLPLNADHFFIVGLVRTKLVSEIYNADLKIYKKVDHVQAAEMKPTFQPDFGKACDDHRLNAVPLWRDRVGRCMFLVAVINELLAVSVMFRTNKHYL